MVLWGIKQKTLNAHYCVVFVLIGMGVLFFGYGMDLNPYFDGITSQQEQANKGHPAFLKGSYSATGWWYYFVVAFLVKTPIVTMIFLAVALVLLVGKAPKGMWMDEMFLLIPAAAVFVFFSLHHKDIGLRYILPVYPFLFVFASRAAQWFLSNKLLAGLSVGLTGWYVGASCWIHPHYLAYFNELAGGSDNGYKYLVDSTWIGGRTSRD